MTSNTMTLLLLPLMVVAFYFLLIRPQRKRAQAQQKLLSEMQPGERVVTHSGIFGTLVSSGEKQSVLQIAPGVEITVLKQAIARVVRPEDEDEAGDALDDETVEGAETDALDSEGTAVDDPAYDPYRPGEPSSLDLPPTPVVDEPTPATPAQPTSAQPQPAQPTQPAAEGSQAGIRDVTSSYFSRPESDADAGSETGRQTKDS